MIKIKDLSVRNFLSVGNAAQSVKFDKNALTLVLGENLDLGGESVGAKNGVGKSSILNALSYGLYGSALTFIKKDNLINRTNAKNMLVSVDFSVDDVDYRIERGRKPNVMRFFVAGKEKEITDDSQGDSRETQAEIERILGMSHDMFRNIVALNTYTEPFLSLKAADQRVIIEQLLGITLLSEKAEILKESIRLVKDSISQEEFRIKAVTDANKRIEEQIVSLKKRQGLWQAKHDDDLLKLVTEYQELATIDIAAELQAHKDLLAFNTLVAEQKTLNKGIKSNTAAMTKEVQNRDNLLTELSSLKNHKCYACGQDFHDKRHQEVIDAKRLALKESEDHIFELSRELRTMQNSLVEVGQAPETHYKTEAEAIHHNSTLQNLEQRIATKDSEQDPYADQIAEMSSTALEEIDFTTINDLIKKREHQEFLLKLLVNKDSFIRKQIIDQNLVFLNAQLERYLNLIGLPHTVKFQNDLSVYIEELGRELDYGNLSRGESTRLILSLSLAFRDVWENLYKPINLLFVDELIDSGMDSAGVENSMHILKDIARDKNKSVWLISHRDELAGRVGQVMKVIKESGFTSFSTDVDIN